MLDRFSLTGKKALIVCPENPYGLAAAKGLQQAGAEIWFAGETPVTCDFPIAGQIFYVHGSAESAKELEQAVRRQMHRLDILVEAGLHTEVSGWQQDFDAINKQLQKAHFGMMCAVQTLGHIMAEQGQGSVIVLTDYGAIVGYDPANYADCPEFAATDFSFAKGFIAGGAVNYVRQASNYLAEHGCRCNAIACAPMEGSCPKPFGNAFARHNQVKRLMTAEDLASAVVFLASDASAYITGGTLPVDGGYTAK